MNARQLVTYFRNAWVCLIAIAIGLIAGAAHADGAVPTSTVGTPPMPEPISWVGDPPSLTVPAVLSYVQTASAPEHMMNVHGIAFEDMNANGKRDAGEPAFSIAWFKLSGGGNWFTCSNVESNGTFGLPVKAGEYFIQPINMNGYRVTTPQLDVMAMGRQPKPALIGYVRDANATAEGCDAYNPGRPLK
jgi:hypothetical protein